jgi:hypothetical protein
MKLIRFTSLCLVLLAAAAFAQTVDLGQGAYANQSGAILVAVDASVAQRTLDSPYVMFVVYLAANGQNQSMTVAAKDVVMVYKGREYPMPSFKELRDKYAAEIRDIELYRRLGKEGIGSSWVRFYEFPEKANFFPPLTMASTLAVNEGYMVGNKGFLTPMYFKNPGFAKGDKLTIKVRDKKNPALSGECEVVLN